MSIEFLCAGLQSFWLLSSVFPASAVGLPGGTYPDPPAADVEAEDELDDVAGVEPPVVIDLVVFGVDFGLVPPVDFVDSFNSFLLVDGLKI